MIKKKLQRKKMNKQKVVEIDLNNKILGRIATETANILRGKNKADFSPNQICGEKVIAFNSDKIIFTGKKIDEKKYYSHSSYLGHLKETKLKDLFNKDSGEVFKRAVKGMLPKNRLQKEWLKNLQVFKGQINE